MPMINPPTGNLISIVSSIAVPSCTIINVRMPAVTSVPTKWENPMMRKRGIRGWSTIPEIIVITPPLAIIVSITNMIVPRRGRTCGIRYVSTRPVPRLLLSIVASFLPSLSLACTHHSDTTHTMSQMIATSCVSSWLPFLPVEEDNDPATMPEGAISCGGEDSYCDCGRDCVAYAESWCACADALTCCEDNNSYEVYDADNNGVPDSFIQCADSFTVCDCSNDCTFNRDQCQCADAQACCAPHVNCPDSPPNDHCNCASDCENNPQFCTCDEAQTCCAEYVPSIGQLQTGEEEAIGNDSNNDFPIVASPPQETGSDATDVADENSEVVIVVNEGSSSSSSSSETNEASYGFKCNTIREY